MNHPNGEEYQSVFENATEGIFQSTSEGRFIKVNRALARIFGYKSPEDMLESVSDLSKLIHVDVKTRRQFVEELANHDRVESFEARSYRKDRSLIWTCTNARTVRDASGQILYIEGFLTDISLQKEAQTAFIESNEKYRALVERLPGAVFLDSPGGLEKTLYISPKIEDLLGYTPEEWVSEVSWPDIVHPEDRDRIIKASKYSNETGEPFREEYRIQKNSGAYIWIKEETSLVEDEHARPLFWQGFFSDLSEQKEVENAIVASEEQFKKVFQSNPIASLIATLAEGRLLAANDSYWRLSGYQPEQFIGHTTIEMGFVSEESRKKLVARLIKEKTLRNVHGKIVTKNGEIRNSLEFYELIVFDGKECILAMFHDMTDQVKAQQALQENEEKYRQLFEAESDAIFLIDNKSGRILEANAAATTLYGYSKEELLQKRNSDLSAEPTDTRQVTQTSPLNKDQVVTVPLRYHLKKDGTVFPVEITGRFFVWHDRPVHIAAIRDITERKRVEEALRESDQNFRNIVEHTTNIYYSHTPEHILTFTSPQTREILGYEPSEILINWHELLTDNPINQEGMELTQKAIDTGKRQDTYILELKHKNGQNIWVEVHESPILQKGKTVAIVGALTDITERKRTEDLLTRQLDELTILHNVALTASSAKSLDELIKRTTDIVYEALLPANCGVELVSEREDTYSAHPSYRGIETSEARRPASLATGITGKVISTGKSVMLGDVSQDPDYMEATKGVRSELCVPVKIQDRIIGAFNLESKQVGAFDESDQRLLNTIAGTLATAIEQLRLFETEKNRRQKAETLLEATTTLTTSLNVSTLLDAILEILSKIVPYDSASIALEQDGKLRIVAGRGFPKTYNPVGTRLAYSEEWLRLSETHTPLILSDVLLDQTFEQWEGSGYIRGWMAVPLIVHGKLKGFINLDSRTPNAFTDNDAILAQTFANSAAVAIENARLFEVEQQSRQKAEALREATVALTASLELESLYETILDSLEKLVPFDSASIEIFHQGLITVVAGRSLLENKSCIGQQYPLNTAKWGSQAAFRTPIIIPDVQEDERFVKFDGTNYIRGWMGVPLLVQDKLVGFLNLDSATKDFFTKDHAALAQTFGNQAAIAIENARLFHEESRRTQIIESMANIANEFATAHEIIPALDKITQRALELLHASSVAIYLLEDDNETIRVVSAQGTYREQLLSHTIQVGMGITGNIVKTGEPEVVDDVYSDTRRVTVPGTPAEDAQRDTMMSAPLILRGKTIGTINAWRNRLHGLFDASELNFLVTIANQTSMSIESIRLFQETARRAQEAHAIAEVGRDVSATLQLDIVLERIAKYAKDLLRAETSAVYLFTPEDELLRAVAAIGIESDEIKNYPLKIGSGILGNIASQKCGEIVNHTLNDPRAVTIQGTETDPNEHLMGVPVLSKDQLTGLLAVWRTGEEKDFKLSELDFLSSLAQQAAVAIENARLFEAEQKRRHESEILRQASAALTSSLEVEEVLNTLLDQIATLIHFNSAAVFLQDKNHYIVVAGKGFKRPEKVIGKRFPLDDKLSRVVRDSGQAIVSYDIQSDLRFQKWGDSDGIHGWMCLPLKVRGLVIGHLTIDSYEYGAYHESDAELAMAFANQAALAIHNARQFEAEQRHFQEAETLRQAAEAITSTLEIRQVLDLILENLKRVVPFDSASVFLIENEQVHLTAYKGLLEQNNYTGLLFPADNALFGEILKSGRPLILDDARADPRYERWVVDHTRGWMGIPLISRGTVIGYITIDSLKTEAYQDHDAILAMTFAHQAAAAIENARLYERGEQQIRQLTVLRDIDSAISSSFDLRLTLNLLIGYAIHELNADAASILLFNPELKSLYAYTSTGFMNKHTSLTSHLRIGEGLAGQVVLHRKVLHFPNLGDTADFLPAPYMLEEKFSSYAGVPLISKGQVKGVMEIYMRKESPPDPDWFNFLQTLAGQAAIAIDNVQLFRNLQRTNQELTLAYDTTLAGWGRALELRDKETQGHTDRVVDLTLELARRMGIAGEELTHIMRGTLLHDIGKMGIPDHILHKPGPLTDEEWTVMRQHPRYAFDLMNPIPYLRQALDIPYGHHERWDGSGYPRGLKGEEIPLAARIFAVVDIWDALSNQRVYRDAWPEEKVLNYLKSTAGIELDPVIVEKFLELIEEKRTENQAE